MRRSSSSLQAVETRPVERTISAADYFIVFEFEDIGSYSLSLHRRQELGVRLGLLESLQHDFHLLSW